jgi:myo-inositol 2-dehydrogenase / D-chiro-inositol 1-dehydrogenase
MAFASNDNCGHSAASAHELNRRQLIQNGLATSAAVGIASQSLLTRTVHAAGSDIIKVGLVGCGGRGNGAAKNAANADPGVRLTAIGDIFEDRLQLAKPVVMKSLGEQYAVEDDHCFSGWDAFDQVLNSGIDVVLLCTPPYFRPAQMEAAVKAGKHIFCEKPVAVDPVGVRSVMESSKNAAAKGLSLVSGLCWRYDAGVLETMKRLLDGAIGQITATQANYLTNTLWLRNPKPDWTPMHTQVLNWMYYRWLSGDHIVEQFIHSLDKALWLRKDVPPVRCYGMGGRQVRTEPEWGDVYDHFTVIYEWADGSRTTAITRQMDGCFNDVQDYIVGTDGTAKVIAHEIHSDQPWKYELPSGAKKQSMYDLEHVALFNSIREGKPINNGDYMCKSTLMAIMGREACYSGTAITWEEAMKSDQKLGPSVHFWGEAPEVEVRNPGKYKAFT